MKKIIVLLLLNNLVYAQINFSLKKEGNSIVMIAFPEDYTIREDTISSSLRLNKKYVHYHFRRTRINNEKCNILIHSRLSPIFDSLKNINSEKIKEMFYENIKKNNSPHLWIKSKVINHEISFMKKHLDGYYYVDVYEVVRKRSNKLYTSSMSRIFVIDGIEHEVSVYTRGHPHNKTPCRSKKAICSVFEELVHNLIIE
ncbi:MAG: hypothetical protein AB8E82_02650 [Aureispira sp.]